MRRLPENKKQYELEKKHVSAFGQIADNPTTSQLIQMLERLNAKSSNLLQHVSIITAIASVFFISATPEDNPKNEIFRSIIIGEICLYLTVALGCVYVAWMTDSTDIACRNKEQF